MAGGGDGEGRSGGGGGEEQEERTDGWMTTYSDMVTLLLTFFVLMFAISNVDSQKAMLFFAGLSRDGLTTEQYLSIMELYGEDHEFPQDEYAHEWPYPPSPGRPATDGEDGNQQLLDLMNTITEYIDINNLGDAMAVTFDGEFLLLTLADDIQFATGLVDITPQMRERAEVIAHMLANVYEEDNPFEVVVAGHTDNVPISTPRYPSNWHVSMDRAVNFMEVLIFESGLDPGYFHSRGCGEFRPLATNETPEGRAINRRIEVKVSLSRDDFFTREHT